MTDWHEDSAARSRRLRGEKTVEQRLADIEARLDALELKRHTRGDQRPYSWHDAMVGLTPRYWTDDMRARALSVPDHDPLGR
jgi:hypothetical protein